MIRDTTRTPGARLARAFCALTACALTVITPTAFAPAQDQDGMELVGFEAETLGDAITFVARTRSGKPIPADRITFKLRRNVVRITYVDVPLASDLGRRIDFDVSQLPRVSKGYAQRENRHQALVRLKFDTDAEEALKGRVVAPVKGGTAVLIPFGDLGLAARFKVEHGVTDDPPQVADGPPVQTDLAKADSTEGATHTKPNDTDATAPPADQPSPKPGYMPPVPGIEEANQKAEAPIKRPYKPILPPGQPATEDNDAQTALAPTPVDTEPLQLADSSKLPSLSRVAGALLLIGVLLLALVFGLKRLQQLNPGRLRLGQGSVNVLATWPLSRGHAILFVDILDEVAVIGQSPNALTLLYRLDPQKVATLRAETATAGADSLVDVLTAKLSQRLARPDAPIDSLDTQATRATEAAAVGGEPLETLEDLARSLEANARAGAARRSQELEALQEPPPPPTSRSALRRTAPRPRQGHPEPYRGGRAEIGFRDSLANVPALDEDEALDQQLAPPSDVRDVAPPPPQTRPTFGGRARASSSSRLRPVHTSPRRAAANSDDEPIDFAEHLSKVNSQDRAMLQSDSGRRARSLRSLHNRDAADAEHALDEEDILEATRAYRDRLRSMSRL